MSGATAVQATTAGWAGELLRSWDEQQQGFLPRREQRFAVMADVVERLAGPRARVLDLGAGPGSTSDRLLRALPGATCVAVDADPVLLAIGTEAYTPEWGDRLRFVDADLRDPEWVQALPTHEFDAVVSTTALHWLDAGSLHAVYAAVHGLLRPGGVVLNGDGMPYSPDAPTAGRLAQQAYDAEHAAAFVPGGAGDWEGWWEQALARPELADAGRARDARRAAAQARYPVRPEGATSYALHRAALLDAGFVEVDTVWQWYSDRVLLAVKAS
ncbi:class I SAM-dependent methyltransferase [Motilibacter deserti]|uniref:Class I SAM-dependent methyltransferase n=1 Tax=Motilibacter deserti TaxID=2714956 RepID=A0ABX0GXJ5_9ACTN|nr:class I SAM-dependent methyltransferase [Motilibacter deserti]